MKKGIFLLTLISMTLFGYAVFAGEKAHWGYTGNSGPEHWGELDKEYEMCAKGKNQSPINLTNFIETDLGEIKFSYRTSGTEILNNGHTIQVNYAEGSFIAVESREFELKQFHFHAPSENHINGKPFAMEAHLVHADRNGNLAVIAIMLEEGENNTFIESLWAIMPKKAGEKHALDSNLSVGRLLPKIKDYYRFNGSLTTPPCTEGVWWFVMKMPVSVSKKQVKTFEHVMNHPNNRPIQPVNARPVLR